MPWLTYVKANAKMVNFPRLIIHPFEFIFLDLRKKYCFSNKFLI